MRTDGMIRICGTIATVATLGLTIATLRAQDDPALGMFTRISPHEFQRLMHQPNGIEAVAKIVGYYEWREDDEVWGIPTLDTLVANSPLIVEGSIAAAQGRLVSRGDDILTDYTVEVSDIARGQRPDSSRVTFTARGGTIQFPNGTNAHIATLESDNLHVGSTYILFLAPVQDGTHLECSGAALRVSPQDRVLSVLAQNKLQTSNLEKALGKIRDGDLMVDIRNGIKIEP
jgi:hypothetical protein